MLLQILESPIYLMQESLRNVGLSLSETPRGQNVNAGDSAVQQWFSSAITC